MIGPLVLRTHRWKTTYDVQCVLYSTQSTRNSTHNNNNKLILNYYLLYLLLFSITIVSPNKIASRLINSIIKNTSPKSSQHYLALISSSLPNDQAVLFSYTICVVKNVRHLSSDETNYVNHVFREVNRVYREGPMPLPFYLNYYWYTCTCLLIHVYYMHLLQIPVISKILQYILVYKKSKYYYETTSTVP